MKSKLVLTLSVLSLFFSLTTVSAASTVTVTEKPDLIILIDGVKGTYTDVPIIQKERTLLPLREIATKVGIPNDNEHIIWNAYDRSVTLIKGKTKIFLKIGQNEAYVNRSKKTIDAAPVIYKDRTYVPVRFVSEFLSLKVFWNENPQIVTIVSPTILKENSSIVKTINSNFKNINKYKVQLSLLNIYENQPDESINYSYAVDSAQSVLFSSSFNQLTTTIEKEFYIKQYHYKKQSFSNKWVKKIMNNYAKEYNHNLLGTSGLLNFEYSVYAGFRTTKSGNITTIKSDFMLNKILMDKGIINYPNAELVKSTIMYNHELNAITLMRIEVIYKDSSLKSSVKIEYSDFNGDFTIMIPDKQDIIN